MTNPIDELLAAADAADVGCIDCAPICPQRRLREAADRVRAGLRAVERAARERSS